MPCPIILDENGNPVDLAAIFASLTDAGTEVFDWASLTAAQLQQLMTGVGCGPLSAALLNSLFSRLLNCQESIIAVSSSISHDISNVTITKSFLDNILIGRSQDFTLSNNEITMLRDFDCIAYVRAHFDDGVANNNTRITSAHVRLNVNGTLVPEASSFFNSSNGDTGFNFVTLNSFGFLPLKSGDVVNLDLLYESVNNPGGVSLPVAKYDNVQVILKEATQ